MTTTAVVVLDATSSSTGSSRESSSSSSTSPTLDGGSYPTGRTVPFPYEKPYPQQIGLMDAILQGLKQPTPTSTATTSRTANKNSSSWPPTSILLLESPTGTGKSLSLACASLAWLKYQEAKDLSLSSSSSCPPKCCSSSPTTGTIKSPATTTGNTSTTTTNNDKFQSSSSPTGIDWLDSYQVPSDDNDSRLRALTVAQQARDDLNQALGPFRQPPTTEQQQQQQQQGMNNNSKEEEEARRRTCREHQVRSAITAAKMRQRRLQRKGIVRQRRGNAVPSMKENKSDENDDFCLTDYRSDPENGKNQNNYDDSDNDSLDQDKASTCSTAAMKSSMDDPSRLLEGARLDGSAAASSNHYSSNPPSTWNTPKISSSSNDAISTVGQVTPANGVRKVIYAARTHSQLSQFVQEVRRTHWGKTIRVVALGSRSSGLCGHLSHTSLSESVITEKCLDMQKNKTGSPSSSTKIDSNKRSRSTNKSVGTGGCPLYDRTAVDTLALNLLAQPTDIEEASRLGSTTKTCAYYASRTAVAAAELVVVPYALLLSSTTRQALGLSLRNNLVIVDEGHNLPDAVRSSASAQLDLTTTQAALDQLVAYTTKYLSRLCGRNLHHLGQLRKICTALVKHLQQAQQQQEQPPANVKDIHGTRPHRQLLSPSEFVIELHVDTINLFPLLRYMERSRLSQKLLGFTSSITKTNQQQNADRSGTITTASGNAPLSASDDSSPGLSKHVSPMAVVQTFLEKLTFTADQEGKVVTEPPTSSLDRGGARSAMVRYVVLHPAACCKDLLREPLGLCLVGGTLRPFGFVAAELFDGGTSDITNHQHLQPHQEKPDNDDLVELGGMADAQYSQDRKGGLFQATTSRGRLFTAFTCSHVVPPEHVLLQCVARVGSTVLDVRQPTRNSRSVCDALGNAILEVCQRVPHGVVVFFPSYSYEAFVITYWKTTPLYQALLNCKCLVREPKSSTMVELTLKRYREAAQSSRGALLCSVIGGKLSEGINFANELARAVLVVGLPYPDPTDPVLVETMALLDKSIADRDARAGRNGNSQYRMTGRAYYQNLCLRAVNQSVGRAIRHAGDYAAIVLMDARYQRDGRIAAGLPDWLTLSTPDWQQSEQCSTLTNVCRRLEAFFQNTPPASRSKKQG
jgi:chromosome transmission fidelity protein 1